MYEQAILLRTIELTRYDTRSQRIVVLIGETIQVEIFSAIPVTPNQSPHFPDIAIVTP
ncbi:MULTISPECIES: DUF6888 family protein [unclassified Nostoc]|uniref:DUF6888 family protein n=1 Tax=unclassified Nostoc TaxID=2593658 RepID=UPI0026C55B11